MNPNHTTAHTEDYDMDMVSLWLNPDLRRLIAGAIAGVFAGVVAALAGGLLAVMGGQEFLFSFKAMATIVMGGAATYYGMGLSLLVGFLVIAVLCAILGAAYAHFSVTQALQPLMLVGLVWGLFSWIFLFNLFFPSFHSYMALQLPQGATFFVCVVFGLALTSVSFFDRAMRGNRT